MPILGTVGRAGASLLNAAYLYRYDRAHAQQAMRAVSVIEESIGQQLSKQQKKIAAEYAMEVLGSRRYAPWLNVYTLVSGGFKEGWIPDNYFGKQVYQRVNKSLHAVTEYKSFSGVILKTDTLPDLAYYIDGVIYDRHLSRISAAVLRNIVERSGRDVYVKRDGSNRGRGVAKVESKELGDNILRRLGNCVIQSAIRQHEFFDAIIPGSVATVRITTVKDSSGNIDVRASYLRLGRKETAWVMSANSVRVAIVGKNGEMDSFGYTQDWKRWPIHPDTGFSFRGKRVPEFMTAAKTCVALHARVPHFTVIGWDVTIDRDERVQLIEWNGGHCDIKFSEATTGPCFKGLGWECFRSLPPCAVR